MSMAGTLGQAAHIPAEWLQQVVYHLDRLERSQDALTKALHAHIPRYVYEHGYDPSGHSLTVPPMTGQLEVIDRYLLVVPTGATATLQLGSTFFVPFETPGVYGNRIQVLLQGAQDVRSLTVVGAGTTPSALYLFGTLLPSPLPTT